MKRLLLTLCCLALPALLGAEEYPLRAKFPAAKPIGTDTLARVYDQAVIVDVRSAMEFEVAHINKALHINIDAPGFLPRVEQARAKSDRNPLAFYCNGTTCDKSYEAAELVQKAGFENVFVYDAGVMAWLKNQPERTTLLGQTPAVAGRLIAEEAFRKHLLPFAEFVAKAAAPNAMVIDIREEGQREVNATLAQNRILVIPGVKVHIIPSDRFAAFVKAGGFKDKSLLIADAVGKQVRFAQYLLEEHGYRDYAFLDKGVKGAVEAGLVK